MTWGNFYFQDSIHTAPCTQNGTVLPGHELTSTCECLPTPERQPGWSRAVWYHHDNH